MCAYQLLRTISDGSPALYIVQPREQGEREKRKLSDKGERDAASSAGRNGSLSLLLILYYLS